MKTSESCWHSLKQGREDFHFCFRECAVLVLLSNPHQPGRRTAFA